MALMGNGLPGDRNIRRNCHAIHHWYGYRWFWEAVNGSCQIQATNCTCCCPCKYRTLNLLHLGYDRYLFQLYWYLLSIFAQKTILLKYKLFSLKGERLYGWDEPSFNKRCLMIYFRSLVYLQVSALLFSTLQVTVSLVMCVLTTLSPAWRKICLSSTLAALVNFVSFSPPIISPICNLSSFPHPGLEYFI